MSKWNPLNWFKKAAKFVSTAFVIVFGEQAAKLFAKAAKSMLKTALGAIAMAVVSELEFENLTNNEKREEAVKRIIARAKGEGVAFKTSLVRQLIEIAVERLKGAAESE